MSVTQSDVQFFIDNAGFSYDPMTQTKEQGQRQCAERAAEAEDILMQAMRVGDVSVNWQDDARTGNEFEEVERVESCVIEINGEIVASLFAIWDADTNYRRVIRAELALECLDQLRAFVGDPEPAFVCPACGGSGEVSTGIGMLPCDECVMVSVPKARAA